MPKLNFNPSLHGFHFNNGFVNRIGPLITTSGLCGGMSLAVFNYYRHNRPIPTHRQSPNDFGTPDGLPPDGGRLRNYIFEMQIKSFASALPFITIGATPESSFAGSLAEFEPIKRRIDQGHFVLLGMRGATSLTDGHQTLVYGYEETPVKRLFMYDCNHPNKEIAVDLDTASRTLVHRDMSNNGAATGNRFASYFLQLPLDPNNPDLFTEADKPSYADLVLERIAVPGGFQVPMRNTINYSFAIRNPGQSPATFHHLHIYVRDPLGRNRDVLHGTQDTRTSIPAGQSVTLTGSFSGFDNLPGMWEIGVSCVTNEGHTVPLSDLRQWERNNFFRFNVLAAASATNNWTVIGPQQILSDPTVIKNRAEIAEVFVRTTGNVIARSRRSGNGFTALEVLSGNERFTGNVSGILNRNDKIEIFARGANNNMFNRWQNSPSVTSLNDWSGWNNLGGDLKSDAAVMMNEDKRLEIFAIGRDDRMYKNFHTIFGTWSGWILMPGNIRFAGTPSATSDAAGRIHVVARGIDRRVYINFQLTPNGDYNGWMNFGGTVDDDPVIVKKRIDGRQEIFVRGTDGKLYHRAQLTPNGNWMNDWAEFRIDNQNAALRVGGKVSVSPIDNTRWIGFVTVGMDLQGLEEMGGSRTWSPWLRQPHGQIVSNTAIAIGSSGGTADVFAVDAQARLVHTLLRHL